MTLSSLTKKIAGLVLFLIAAFLIWDSSTGSNSQSYLDDPRKRFTEYATNNEYDQFAWDLFLHLNWPALQGKRGIPDPEGQLGENRTTVWETFKDLRELMRRDGNAPASWETLPPTDTSSPGKYFRSLGFYDSDLVPQVDGFHLRDGDGDLTYFGFRSDKRVFDYIVDRKLYNDEGQLEFFSDPSFPPIEFPYSATQIKSAWLQFSESEAEDFAGRMIIRRIEYPPTGELFYFGLVGLHIMTKVQEDWFWATFEHSHNQSLTNAPLIVHISDSALAVNEKMHSELEGTLWENYNLRGSQWSFEDAAQDSTTLASTVIESRFQSSSSCITCHALASRGPEDDPFIDFFFIDGSGNQMGYIGTPDWNLYCKDAVNIAVSGYDNFVPERFCTDNGLAYGYRSTDYAWIFRLSLRMRSNGF